MGCYKAINDDDFISAQEIYGDSIYSNSQMDYYDTSKLVLKARERTEEYANDEVRLS